MPTKLPDLEELASAIAFVKPDIGNRLSIAVAVAFNPKTGDWCWYDLPDANIMPVLDPRYPVWHVVSVYRDSKPNYLAEQVIASINGLCNSQYKE